MRQIKKIRIGIAGGGTGGHIYPLLSVCDALTVKRGAYDDNVVELHYFGDPGIYRPEFEFRNIQIHPIMGAKLRRYASLQTFIDIPRFFIGIFQALATLLITMPDVVFSKGGPGSIPVAIAAWWYRIPLVVHESDAVPGLSNRISSKFAKRICLSFPESKSFFSEKKIVITGNPVRKELVENRMTQDGAKSFWRMDAKLPLTFIVGGSQGSQRINSLVIENLAELLSTTQVLHQVGPYNYREIEMSMREIMNTVPHEFHARYRAVGFIDANEMKQALTAADAVVSRAGAGAIFEIAAFHKPAVLIPLKESAGDHQRVNAYSYSKYGYAQVLEEENMTIHELKSRIDKAIELSKSSTHTEEENQFFIKNSAQLIAQEILNRT